MSQRLFVGKASSDSSKKASPASHQMPHKIHLKHVTTSIREKEKFVWWLFKLKILRNALLMSESGSSKRQKSGKESRLENLMKVFSVCSHLYFLLKKFRAKTEDCHIKGDVLFKKRFEVIFHPTPTPPWEKEKKGKKWQKAKKIRRRKSLCLLRHKFFFSLLLSFKSFSPLLL